MNSAFWRPGSVTAIPPVGPHVLTPGMSGTRTGFAHTRGVASAVSSARPRSVVLPDCCQCAASSVAGRRDRRPGREQPAVDVLGELGEPGGGVHGVADDRVLEPAVVADVAGDHLAGGDADAGPDLGHLDRQPAGHRPGRGEGRARVVVERHRRAEHREDRVADELVDQAVPPVDLVDDDAEEPVQHRHHVGGRVLGGVRRRPDQVDEQHRHHPGLPAELDLAELGGGLGHLLADVPPEQVPDVLALAQARGPSG